VGCLHWDWPNLAKSQGGDFVRSATGSMLVCSGTTMAEQKLIRWLLTNPRVVLPDGRVLKADYIFNTQFGVGLRREVGSDPSSAELANIKALILQGCQFIDEIAKVPTPRCDLQRVRGGLIVTIFYNDAQSNRPRAMTFPIPPQ